MLSLILLGAFSSPSTLLEVLKSLSSCYDDERGNDASSNNRPAATLPVSNKNETAFDLLPNRGASGTAYPSLLFVLAARVSL